MVRFSKCKSRWGHGSHMEMRIGRIGQAKGGRILFILCILAGLVSGCETKESEKAPIWLDPDDVFLTSYGTLGDDPVFARVVDAAVSPDGRYLTVLDLASPFVHTLDRNTNVSHAFGGEGEGPGEIKLPLGVSFQSDSVLAVLSSWGLDLYSPEGRWDRRLLDRDLGVNPQAITQGCGGDLFAYGVKPAESQQPEPHWLHRIDSLTPPVTSAAFFPIAGRFRVGALEGLDGSKDEVLLWHRTGEVAAGWVLDCQTDSIRLLTGTSDPISVRALHARDVSRGEVHILPDTLFVGAAVAGPNLLVAHTVRAPSGDHSEGKTLIQSWSPKGEGCVTLPGLWLLLDAEADMIAVAQMDPFPRVLLVPDSTLTGQGVVGRPCG